MSLEYNGMSQLTNNVTD